MECAYRGKVATAVFTMGEVDLQTIKTPWRAGFDSLLGLAGSPPADVGVAEAPQRITMFAENYW